VMRRRMGRALAGRGGITHGEGQDIKFAATETADAEKRTLRHYKM
jgi:hypothetical protein